MPRLLHLEIEYTRTSEISFGEGICPNLQYLKIWRCLILEEIGTLPNTLRGLELGDCPNLKQMKKLSALYMGGVIHVIRCEGREEMHIINEFITTYWSNWRRGQRTMTLTRGRSTGGGVVEDRFYLEIKC